VSLAASDPSRPIVAPGEVEEAIRAVLANDHEHLDRSFRALITEASRGDADDLSEEWRDFERTLLRHFETEETQIFPVFGLAEPGEARALLEEHGRIRLQLAELGIDLGFHCLPPERIRSFVDGLRAHALREERLFYPWAAKRLSELARKRANGR
jgi:hemerythrin superfamily protein